MCPERPSPVPSIAPGTSHSLHSQPPGARESLHGDKLITTLAGNSLGSQEYLLAKADRTQVQGLFGNLPDTL